MNFLHIHSMYSVDDSAQSPEDIVKRVSTLGGGNVTLTDHRTLLGVDPFMAAGRKYGVNTIPGMEGEVTLPDHYVRLLSNGDEKSREALENARNHILLIPMNYQGFQAISSASKDANENIKTVAKKDYPCLTDEMLSKHFRGNRHVFATSACIQGPVAYILLLNYRMKKRMARCDASQTLYSDAFNAYTKADMMETELKKRIKELGKEKTAKSKPLKKPFQQKITRLKNKLETELADSPKWVIAQSSLELAMADVAAAEKAVAKLDAEIELLTMQKKEAEKMKAEAKKGYGRYMRADEEKQQLAARMIDEAALYNAAKMRLLDLKSIFPLFYIELQYHGLEEEAYVMPLLLRLADETDTPIIAANDAHITDNSEESVEARRLIRFNFFARSEKVSSSDRELYIKTDKELVEALSKVIHPHRAEEAVRNTNILEQCHVEFPKETHYPKVKGGISIDDALEKARQRKIDAGLWNEDYEKSLRHEIDIIKSMGYSDYHMVVEHFCRVGRLMGRVPLERRNEIYDHFADLSEWVEREGFKGGIGIGPGRGSAAGSLVCYLLGITNIDPIKYNLLFERFLNPERVSMPDIDTDVATSLRPILIAYLRWFYGDGAVCSIATTNTYGAKGAIKLVGRDRADQLFSSESSEKTDFFLTVSQKSNFGKWKEAIASAQLVKLKSLYQHDYTYTISDMIPEGAGVTLDGCEKDILPKISDDPEKMLLWYRAKLIEGVVSGTGVHAGGIVISDNDNVGEYVPLAWNEERDVWVAQCDMVQIEEKGLLKMDLLGLNTLDVDNLCTSLIYRYHGISIDLDAIPFEPAVFREIYASGNTNGVFQVEGGGMKEMLKRFGPTCFEDIILLVAAYRPGPLQYLDDIIEVKNGRRNVSYKHPLLKPILSTTYGATIYQEQVMQIFQALAGYSLGGADLVRRAMSKKKMDKLALEREAFIHGDEARQIDGCVKRGVPEETANEIFDEMMEFAKYAFNKSHAAAYALVSYQTAWLKFHYPTEFLCALFRCKTQDKFAPIFADCGVYNVELLPPDINASHFDFVIENGKIRYGFGGIKGIGEANRGVIKQICEERKAGVYLSIQDFLKRTISCNDGEYSLLPSELLSTLVYAGAFDTFGYNRSYNRMALFKALAEKSLIKKSGKREVICDSIDAMKVEGSEKDSNYNIEKEIDLLGTVCSEHPLASYGKDSLYGCDEISSMENGPVTIFGFVVSINQITTQKGPALKLQLHGKTGTCTVMVTGAYYSSVFREANQQLYRVVKVSGKCFNGTVYANSISRMSAGIKHYTLRLDDFELQQELVQAGGIHKDRRREDDVSLMIWFYWDVHGNTLSVQRTKKIRQRWCTSDFIREMLKRHIIAIDANGELQKAKKE